MKVIFYKQQYFTHVTFILSASVIQIFPKYRMFPREILAFRVVLWDTRPTEYWKIFQYFP